ncbi:MAG: PEP-CTERM sorting domain-containing protein [Akkermansiaceae bacterium]
MKKLLCYKVLCLLCVSCFFSEKSTGAIIYSFTGSFLGYSALDITANNSSDGSGDIYLIPNGGEQKTYLSDVPFTTSVVLLNDQVYQAATASTQIVGVGVNKIEPTLSELEVLDGTGGVTTASNGAILNSTDNFVGFSLSGDPDLSGSVTTVYGWVQFRLGNAYSDSSQMEIIAWAYEGTGESIVLGSSTLVPEPSSLSLLGIAAISLSLIRRRA